MQDHVAACLQRRLGPFPQTSRQRLHRQVVGHDQAAEAQMRPHQLHGLLRGRRRPLRIDGVEHHMGRHRQRHVRQGLERREIPTVEGREIRMHHRQVVVAVGKGPAVARHVFDHRQHAPGQHAFGRGPAELGHCRRIVRIGPVADDVVGTGHRHVQHRQAVHVDPDRLQVMRHQPRAQPDQLARRQRVIHCLQIGLARRIFRPVRRPHPLHPAALLVDQDRGTGVADAVAQRVSQGPHLLRTVDIAPEQDEAPRPRPGEEGAFRLRQPMAATAVDRRRGHRSVSARNSRRRRP